MEVLDVTTTLDKVDFYPSNIHVEVLQNIRTILTTIKGTVPLDRDFGIDAALIDRPINIIKPLLVKEVKEAIEKYEPRAKFHSIVWKGDGSQGKIVPIVKVVIR